MAFSDERDYDEEAANRSLMMEEEESRGEYFFDWTRPIRLHEQEDSYLDDTHADAPTYGGDFMPDDFGPWHQDYDDDSTEF